MPEIEKLFDSGIEVGRIATPIEVEGQNSARVRAWWRRRRRSPEVHQDDHICRYIEHGWVLKGLSQRGAGEKCHVSRYGIGTSTRFKNKRRKKGSKNKEPLDEHRYLAFVLRIDAVKMLQSLLFIYFSSP